MFKIDNENLFIKFYTKNLKKVISQVKLLYKNDETNLIKCLQIIDKMANETNIKTLAIKNNDTIFELIPQEVFKQTCNAILKTVTIILYEPSKIINDEETIQKLISENHDTPTGGHIGTCRLLKRLRSKYYWFNMKRTIAEYIKRCEKCIQNKHRTKTNETFIQTTTPTKSFDLISIDTIGPLTKSKLGNRYALTVQCDLSKYIIIVPIPDKQAATLAKALVEHCILIYGCPVAIKSDLGTEYKNEVFKAMCELLSVKHNFSTAYHPQTIGSLERNHRCLNEYLRHFVNDKHDDWDNWLIYFCFSYNTAPHSAHSFTPFEFIFGKQARLPSQFSETTIIEPVYNYESFVNELKFKLQVINEKTRKLLEKSKTSRIDLQKEISRPIDVSIGSKVWLKLENRRKLDRVYSGPFEVINENHPNVTIRNLINNEIQLVHKNRLIKI